MARLQKRALDFGSESETLEHDRNRGHATRAANCAKQGQRGRDTGEKKKSVGQKVVKKRVGKMLRKTTKKRGGKDPNKKK